MGRELLAVCLLVVALAALASAEPALPETQLPLRLIGTVVAAQTERSIAVIEDLGATKVVRTGDSIGAARVQEIHKDGIVLVQAGRLELLALAPVATGRSAGSAQTSAAASSGSDADTLDAADRASQRTAAVRRGRTAARASATRTSAVPASAARGQDGSTATGRVTSDQLLVNLSGQARYAPQLDGNGQLRGVAIMDVRPDSTLERLGLRSGDVVVSVGGIRVDNSPRAFDALRALDPSAGGEVLVERQGLPTRITVPPGAL